MLINRLLKCWASLTSLSDRSTHLQSYAADTHEHLNKFYKFQRKHNNTTVQSLKYGKGTTLISKWKQVNEWNSSCCVSLLCAECSILLFVWVGSECAAETVCGGFGGQWLSSCYCVSWQTKGLWKQYPALLLLSMVASSLDLIIKILPGGSYKTRLHHNCDGLNLESLKLLVWVLSCFTSFGWAVTQPKPHRDPLCPQTNGVHGISHQVVDRGSTDAEEDGFMTTMTPPYNGEEESESHYWTGWARFLPSVNP